MSRFNDSVQHSSVLMGGSPVHIEDWAETIRSCDELLDGRDAAVRHASALVPLLVDEPPPRGVSLCFSSSCEGLRRRLGGTVGLPVSEHGEQDVDSAPGETDECGVVFLALGSFSVVVGPADGIGSERGER